MTPTEFEHYVQSLYRSLGFRVDHNEDVRGSQTDLLAERQSPGIGVERYLIECKYSTQETISNTEVNAFIANINSLPTSQGISAGIMVTNAEFSKFAKSRAANLGNIRLLTTREIELGVLDPTDAYLRFLTAYENSALSDSYIALSAQPLTTDGSGPRTQPVDAETTVATYALAETLTLTLIQGDYGSGKTTLMNRIKARVCNDYLVSKLTLRPILFLLRDFHSYGSLDEFMIATLEREIGRRLDPEAFWQGAQQRKFLLLLDGFDEMNLRGTPDDRFEELSKLSPFLLAGSNVVMTCRPTYFISQQEMHQTLDKVLRGQRPTRLRRGTLEDSVDLQSTLYSKYVNPRRYQSAAAFCNLALVKLDAAQIKTYLKQREDDLNSMAGVAAEDTYAFIQKIYDLADLVSRPLLLSMIVETILTGKLDIGGKQLRISASQLYEVYTTTVLDRDWHKGVSRQELSTDQRREFMIALAVTMFDHERLEVTPEEVSKAAIERIAVDSRLRLQLKHLSEDTLASDVRLCSFLSMSANGLLRFTHKSFFDYYVAVFLHESILKGALDDRLCRPLGRHFLYFMGGFLFRDATARRAYYELLRRGGAVQLSGRQVASHDETTIVRNNVAGAILFSGKVEGPLIIHNARFSDRDVTQLDLSDLTLSALSFESTTWERVLMDGVIADGLKINSSALRSLRLTGNTTIEAQVTQSELHSLTANHAQISLTGSQNKLFDWKLANSEVSVTGECQFESWIADDCSLKLIAGEKGVFRNCSFAGGTCKLIGPTSIDSRAMTYSIQGCLFTNCGGLFVLGRYTDLDSCSFEGCEGFVAATGWPREKANKLEARGGVLWFSADEFNRIEKPDLENKVSKGDSQSLRRQVMASEQYAKTDLQRIFDAQSIANVALRQAVHDGSEVNFEAR